MNSELWVCLHLQRKKGKIRWLDDLNFLVTLFSFLNVYLVGRRRWLGLGRLLLLLLLGHLACLL
jgi:hypothetical protein